MLDGIVTGYEPRFDFPVRSAPPELGYLLATVPRTGSTFVSHLLWRTGCLGAPLEYLNFDPSGPYGSAHGNPKAQQQIWAEAVARRTSPNGVFGLKGFPMQLQDLVESNPVLLASVMSALLPRGAPARIIHLRRRDRLAHRISYARATISGVWRQEQEQGGSDEVAYSDAALATAERWLGLQEQAWNQMFAEMGIVPLTLWYEDAVAAPDATAAAVADHLGVALQPQAQVAVPPVRRQSQAGARAWVAQAAPRDP
jgi:LPS sulfotransferase NodH